MEHVFGSEQSPISIKTALKNSFLVHERFVHKRKAGTFRNREGKKQQGRRKRK
jgi:hypothetical protein